MAATYRRNTIELTFEGVQGGGPWATGKKDVDRLVTVTLVWPRPLVAERVAARSFRFQPPGLDLSGRDWSERILFKENVEGPFGLVVQISGSLTAREYKRVAAALGGGLLRAVGSEAAGVAIGPGLTSLARFPFTFLAGELSSAGNAPDVMAAGRITLEPGTNGLVEVPLEITEDIVRLHRIRRAGRTQTRRETTHRQGDPAGVVQLNAVYYRD